MDKVKGALDNKLNKSSQPGNQVESRADNTANQNIDNTANQAGVPAKDNDLINKAADSKINTKIPGGNN
ncbi:hypothetical protein F5B20DRAFT_274015 [Whalleya microplaca]|nr:hypothetical protein F5B20DRAFT_274015 [Whalleya microplaca]